MIKNYRGSFVRALVDLFPEIGLVKTKFDIVDSTFIAFTFEALIAIIQRITGILWIIGDIFSISLPPLKDSTRLFQKIG